MTKYNQLKISLFAALTLLAYKATAQPWPVNLNTGFAQNGAMYIGVDYYPEYWPEERWATDLKLMKAAQINVVRLAEYAWTRMEPIEGQYNFDWLNRFVKQAQSHNIAVVLCTPSDAIPAWMANKYPEVMATDNNGVVRIWGGRKHADYSSGAYRLFNERITRAMAQEFKNTENVIGWQTSNEFGPPESRSYTQQKNFQDFLKQKYRTLDSLNQAWGTAFWSQTITRWDEIPLPIYWRFNPSLSLDFKHFHTQTIVKFQQTQIEILKQTNPKWFVTHNLIGHHMVMDYPTLAQNLDFVSWDNYPVESENTLHYNASLRADIMRGIKNKYFWIMEQVAGPNGVKWEEEWIQARNLYPGELKKLVMQQVAHGANGIMWFRWRNALTGREQYWSGLLPHSGIPGWRYHEATETIATLRKYQKTLQKTHCKNQVAFLLDYPTNWATHIQPVYKQNHYLNRLHLYYNALRDAGVQADVVRYNANLSQYKLVFAPNMLIMPNQVAHNIEQFVANGGIFVTDWRSCEKDPLNRVFNTPRPGKLTKVLGIEIHDYSPLMDQQTYTLTATKQQWNQNYTVRWYADYVETKTAQTILKYNDWKMKPYAALTTNQYGKGHAWFVGGVVKQNSFYQQLITEVLKQAGLTKHALPKGLELVCRYDNKGKPLVFLINHNQQKLSLSTSLLNSIGINKFDPKTPQAKLILNPFEVKIIE